MSPSTNGRSLPYWSWCCPPPDVSQSDCCTLVSLRCTTLPFLGLGWCQSGITSCKLWCTVSLKSHVQPKTKVFFCLEAFIISLTFLLIFCLSHCPIFIFAAFVASALIQYCRQPSTGSQCQTMQKRQGNGVQGKQAVSPHESSWLETIGPRPTWVDTQHLVVSEHSGTASGQKALHLSPGRRVQCDNYSLMTPQLLHKRQPWCCRRVVGYCCCCHKTRNQVYQLERHPHSVLRPQSEAAAWNRKS